MAAGPTSERLEKASAAARLRYNRLVLKLRLLGLLRQSRQPRELADEHPGKVMAVSDEDASIHNSEQSTFCGVSCGARSLEPYNVLGHVTNGNVTEM